MQQTALDYPFTAFPFFDGGRRPIVVKGSARCRLISVAPGVTGDPGLLRWQIAAVSVINPKDGTPIDYTQDQAFRQDFDRWLKGKHGYAIEAALRNLKGETKSES